jgi:hypothetical protein
MIGSIGFHGETKAQSVDNSNILGFNVDTAHMKYPSLKHFLADNCWDVGGSGIGELATTPDTRGTRNTGCRNQQTLGLLASDFDLRPPKDSGLLYGILKRSIIGGP